MKLRMKALVVVSAGVIVFGGALAVNAATSTPPYTPVYPGQSTVITHCPPVQVTVGTTVKHPKKDVVACSEPTTTTTTASTTTTTEPATTTTTQPSGGNCTNPVWTSSDANGAKNFDGGNEYWWVGNDAWNGSHGPQTINACSATSWYATSNQPNNGGAVETYPDTEYDVGGRQDQSTTPISGFSSITSSFAESNPSAGGWDAAYDLWTDNWAHETMIWNQWAGSQSFWPSQANGSGGFALTLAGVPYHFFANGSELMFFRDTQVTSGSVDLLAAWNWEVAHGFATASQIPTQIEYGTEVAYTSGTETFNTTGMTVNINGTPAVPANRPTSVTHKAILRPTTVGTVPASSL